MTRADWLALAERVEREDAGYTINNDVGCALLGLGPDDYPPRHIEYSESLDAAASAMPEGWNLDAVHRAGDGLWWEAYAMQGRFRKVNDPIAFGRARDEPRARLAAALRARAEGVG